MGIYAKLKERQRRREKLLPSERDWIDKVERLADHSIELLLPKGSTMTIGAEEAEKILCLIHPQPADLQKPPERWPKADHRATD